MYVTHSVGTDTRMTVVKATCLWFVTITMCWSAVTSVAPNCAVAGRSDCLTCVQLEGCAWCGAGKQCGPKQNSTCPTSDIHFRGPGEPDMNEGNRHTCSYVGIVCGGKCFCDDGFYGDECQCDGPFTQETCISPTATARVPCNGRGICVCGQCDCYDKIRRRRFSGQYCECDDYGCPYYNNMLCGGQGTCQCGQCRCKPGYSGEACDCYSPEDGSIPESCLASNGVPCNGFGTCQCGTCVCEGIYKGPTCEECPTCPGLCQKHKDCVMCTSFGTGPLSSQECEERCTYVTLYSLIDRPDDAGSDDSNWKLCSFLDPADDCRFKFWYSKTDGGSNVMALTTKVCSPPSGSQGQGLKYSHLVLMTLSLSLQTAFLWSHLG